MSFIETLCKNSKKFEIVTVRMIPYSIFLNNYFMFFT